jgi:5-methyltetrahydrofolate corrinoid/iron sulfur protein methyltransferase
MEAGLEACKDRKAIINGFSLEPKKLEKMLPLAKAYNASIVGYLLHPDSRVPVDASERLSIAVELYKRFKEEGLDNGQLIIDPIVVPITWENGAMQSREVLTVIRKLPELLGFPVKTIAGVSNLTSGKASRKKKQALEAAYISMLAEAGLSMALVNMFHDETLMIARACNVLSRDKIFTWEEL